MSWTIIPRWLYENNLPDDQLQEFYVKAAHRKLAQLRAEQWELGVQIAEAEAFLADAEAALARYKRRRRGA